jgi:hypothetical protein
MLCFNDGVNIDTSGELRIIKLVDGWYVVGEGMSIPCRDRWDAQDALDDMLAAREALSPHALTRGVLLGLAVSALAVVGFALAALLLAALSPKAAGGQVTAVTEMHRGVAELRVGNPTRSPLTVRLHLYRDKTREGGPVTLGDKVPALISPQTFTLLPGTVQIVRIRVRGLVWPGELLRLTTTYQPRESPLEGSGGMRLMVATRVVTKVLVR